VSIGEFRAHVSKGNKTWNGIGITSASQRAADSLFHHLDSNNDGVMDTRDQAGAITHTLDFDGNGKISDAETTAGAWGATENAIVGIGKHLQNNDTQAAADGLQALVTKGKDGKPDYSDFDRAWSELFMDSPMIPDTKKKVLDALRDRATVEHSKDSLGNYLGQMANVTRADGYAPNGQRSVLQGFLQSTIQGQDSIQTIINAIENLSLKQKENIINAIRNL
jgi:hypothetical protein